MDISVTGEDIAVDVSAVNAVACVDTAADISAVDAVACVDTAADISAVDAVARADTAADISTVDTVSGVDSSGDASVYSGTSPYFDADERAGISLIVVFVDDQGDLQLRIIGILAQHDLSLALDDTQNAVVRQGAETVLLRFVLPQQVIDGNIEEISDSREQLNIGIRLRTFPLADRLHGNAELPGELFLRAAFGLSQIPEL